mgnify:CR=1 FL=1
MKGKSLAQSKTFWFNLLAVLVAVATWFGFGSFEPDPKVLEALGVLAGLVNVVLRLVTDKPITKVV